MRDPEVWERIAARSAELDEAEEQLVNQLSELRAERDELAVAERVWQRMSDQLAEERAAATPQVAQVAGRAVRLVPDRKQGVKESALPPEYQRILAAVRQAAGPVMVRQVGEALGLRAVLPHGHQAVHHGGCGADRGCLPDHRLPSVHVQGGAGRAGRTTRVPALLRPVHRRHPGAATVADRVVLGFASSLRAIRHHPLIGGLLAVEPESVTPSMTSDGGRTMAVVREFVAGRLRREQHAGNVAGDVDVDVVAEMMVRVSTSFLVIPSQVIDLDDEEQVRAVARQFLVPMLGPPPPAHS